LICIFPEGGLTKDGEIQPFRAGIKRIIDRTPVPVVPIALRGLWNSFFGRQGGALIARIFRLGLFGKVGISVGTPVPAYGVTPEGLQALVTRLRGAEK
jgi:1-acyl-sn-glycerol-3-phosphate acyltransferase